MNQFKSFINRPDTKGEFYDQPSLTVPDQTMSMRTIMERYAKGLPVTDAKEPIYDEDPENSMGVDLRRMDLVDLQELEMNAKRVNAALKRKKQTVVLKADQEEASTNIP